MKPASTPNSLPGAWVAKYKQCGCTINCWAIDPQSEHLSQAKTNPPVPEAVQLSCSCCWSALRYLPKEIFRGHPALNEKYSHHLGFRLKTHGAVMIAASTIAAIRLRGEPIEPSSKLRIVIRDSVLLAKLILAELDREQG